MTAPYSDLLAGLTTEEAADVMALARPHTLGAGERLFRIGEPAEAVYLIERGRVLLTLPVHVGGREEDVLVEERAPGQVFGWSGLIPPHRFTLNAAAPLDTQLLVLSRAALVEHFTARPQIAYVITRNLAAVVGHRLQVLQAMWLREVQHLIELRCA